ncbi:MAG: hypothetical protein ABSE73_02280 [Planctomycetota bacterium]
MLPKSSWAVLAVLAGLGLSAQAADSFGENLVDVKLALPKGDTYVRGATDPVLNLIAEITLVNTSEKEKREKESVSVDKADFVSVEELVALESELKKTESKDAALSATSAVADKKKGKTDIEAWPVNPKSLGAAYVEPELGPHDVIDFVITKLPEEGQTVPEGAKPVLVPRDNKPDTISLVDIAETKYLAAGESSPPYALPVGKFYRISEAGLYSIKAVYKALGNSAKPSRFAESNEEKFRVLPFKAVDQKIEELKRNWEFYERGTPNFDYQLYQVRNEEGYDEVYWVQRIKSPDGAKWEWERLCSVKPSVPVQVAYLGPSKVAVLAVQSKGDACLYTLDFTTLGPKVTAKTIELKEGAAPKLKVEGGAPSVE